VAVVACPACGAELEVVRKRGRRERWAEAVAEAELREAVPTDPAPADTEGGEQ
jgi:uncharacterized protein YbaR (Trm112 family)